MNAAELEKAAKDAAERWFRVDVAASKAAFEAARAVALYLEAVGGDGAAASDEADLAVSASRIAYRLWLGAFRSVYH